MCLSGRRGRPEQNKKGREVLITPPGPVDKPDKEAHPMTILSPAPIAVKPAARVLFDSATFVHHAPDFGAHAAPDRMTVDQEMAYWDGVAAKKKAEYAAREVVVQAMLAEARRPASKTSPRDFILEGLVWEPRPAGYDAQDAADFAAGRTITRAELEAREEAEEEARLLANCPAEVHEEMLQECEWARPFLA
jgi:hypothetical protein